MPFITQGKTNWKFLVIVIVLALIVGGGALWHARRPEKPYQPPEIKKTEQSNNFLYYYYQSYNPDSFTIKRFNFDISKEDNLVAKLDDNFSIIGKYSENGKFFARRGELWESGNKLYILDVKTGELKEFLSVEEGKGFDSAVFSHDKKFLAYSLFKNVNANGGEDVKEIGEVWIYDLMGKNNIKIFETELFMSGLFVEGWNKKDDKLIVRELGGEGGESWGRVYLVETIKTVDNYLEIPQPPQPIGNDFLFGALSPDGENWLYHSCEKPTSENHPEYWGCEEGAKIIAYNFEKSESATIYQNTLHADNIYKSKLRVINSTIWQDNENIIFSIPQGIYKINLYSKKPEELYTFYWSNPDEIFRSPPLLIYARDNVVIYYRGGEHFILNLSTKKNIGLGKNISDISWFLE